MLLKIFKIKNKSFGALKYIKIKKFNGLIYFRYKFKIINISMKTISIETLSTQLNGNKHSYQEKGDALQHNENNYCEECNFISKKFLNRSFLNHSNCKLSERDRGILITKDIKNESDQIGRQNSLHFGNNEANKTYNYFEANDTQSLLKFNDYCVSSNLSKLEKILKEKLANRQQLESQINERSKELKAIEDSTAKISGKYFKYLEIDQNLSKTIQNLTVEIENKNYSQREKNDILSNLENSLAIKEEETKSLALRVELANIRIKEASWMKEEKDTELFLVSKLIPEYDNEIQNLNKMAAFNAEEIKELKEAEAGLKEIVSNLEDDIKDQRGIVKELTSTINELNIRSNKLQESLAKTKVKKTKLKFEIKEIRSNIEQNQEFYFNNESELRKLNLQASGTIKSLDDLSQEISAHCIMFGEIERSPINRKTILSSGRKSMIF
ncbi:unnamed protein product [Blepharisma stoltei]|uniref:Uncharacterized protein n=1 Tax=Blepharisma stoltei TaxID=1481888 RepID=A0AAU9KDT1_9CILI|nr:unnamed protein product [Blepharisma stoltei]